MIPTGSTMLRRTIAQNATIRRGTIYFRIEHPSLDSDSAFP